MSFPERCVSDYKSLNVINRRFCTTESLCNFLAQQIQPRLGKEHDLIRICCIGKHELARLINSPHGIFHFLKATQIIGAVKQIVVGDIPLVSHLEGSDVLNFSRRTQLTHIQVMKKPVSFFRPNEGDAFAPIPTTEKSVEIFLLIWMADEPVPGEILLSLQITLIS